MITTLEQFIENVPKDGWTLNHGMIRRRMIRRKMVTGGLECPLMALGFSSALDAVLSGRVSGALASSIASAADDSTNADATIRARLLAVFGLNNPTIT